MAEIWTILKLLQWTTDFFKRKGIEQARANAEVLLAHVLSMERVGLYLHYDQPLSPVELSVYREAVRRRAAREPAQYITQKQEFWSLEFEVNPFVLIPRPETELLVAKALEILPDAPSLALDLGTGSGAIAVALAHERPRLRLIASDISPPALEVAKRNALRHGVGERIAFVASDLLAAFPPARPSFDLVASNPPYIGGREFEALPPEIARHEPLGALEGGGVEGLDVARKIIAEAPPYLKPGGWLLMEIGRAQASLLERELSESRDFDSYRFFEDFSGIMRLLALERAG
jgi:release factor glutamine methyltransferase